MTRGDFSKRYDCSLVQLTKKFSDELNCLELLRSQRSVSEQAERGHHQPDHSDFNTFTISVVLYAIQLVSNTERTPHLEKNGLSSVYQAECSRAAS